MLSSTAQLPLLSRARTRLCRSLSRCCADGLSAGLAQALAPMSLTRRMVLALSSCRVRDRSRATAESGRLTGSSLQLQLAPWEAIPSQASAGGDGRASGLGGGRRLLP